MAADLALTPRASIPPNVGLSTTTDDQGRRYTSALGAFTFVYAPTQALQPFVDVGFISPESRGGGSSVVFDTGLALIVRRDSQIDLEVGWSAAGRTTPNVFLGAGFSHRF